MRALWMAYRFLVVVILLLTTLAFRASPAAAASLQEDQKNFIPDAYPDNSITLEGRPVEIKVLANDKELKDDPIIVTITNPPDHGAAVIILEDKPKIKYTPAAGYIGTDTYEYTVCDRDLECDSAVVTVTIQPVAEDPASPDAIPPTVAWEGPVLEGEVLNVGNEKITLSASATDNVGVVKVIFLWWDASAQQYVTLGEDSHAPFELTFNTSVLDNGWNQIFVRSVDAAGNSSDYPFIWLYKTVMDHHVYLPYARK